MFDHQFIEIPSISHVWLRRTGKQWQIIYSAIPYPSGPLSRILTSALPIALVIPAERAEYYETIALRIAHNLYTYLKLDCNILRDSEVDESLEGRNVVVIGGHHNKYGMTVRSSPLQVSSDGCITVEGKRYSGSGIGALSLHKHHLYMDAFEPSGYERILRMFPLRTGVPGPEWMIVGPDCDTQSYGGLLAAGFWDRDGGLSESMSYLA
ncbi:unnamed protein product [Rhizoctonia solani]|uniref:Uncharacterized protein n=1 Tax=Rhizoctonia solani TaxID=456999 RepID=A0A8H3HVB4_9AGAM|nr:unnamed protein product [Rhizoctonia solani]